MRKFEETHPWLTFEIDLNSRISAALWVTLGEIESKCQHLADIPIQPQMAERLHEVYLAKGAFATTAIEGNTLSETEVRQYLEGTLKLPSSREYLGKEIDNIVTAFNSILHRIEASKGVRMSPELWSFFNRTVLDGLELDDPGAIPGEIRNKSVGVANYRGAPPEDCLYLIQTLCDWLNGNTFDPPENKHPIIIALIKAIVAHVYFVWIHPYDDGNGRTARLIEVSILLQSGVPSSTAHLLSNHYNATRRTYYKKLAEASENGGDLLPFIQYAVEGFAQELRDQVKVVKLQQINVAWINYIHDLFSDSERKVDRRQRDLVLGITENEGFVRLNDIPDLNTRLAKAYVRTTTKTIQRDLDALVDRGLLVKERQGYRARVEQMLSFLPVTNPEIDRELHDALVESTGQMSLF